jgi:rod shape-determining protein MreD
MDQATLRFPGAILLSVLIALVLTLLPLPESWQAWKPEWLALTFIHWALLLPRKISFFLVWFIGLLVDTLSGTLLGQHAFGFLLVLYLSIRLGERMTARTLMQQLTLIFIALGAYLLISLWILRASDYKPQTWTYWLPLLSSLIVWPIYHYFLSFLHIIRKEL